MKEQVQALKLAVKQYYTKQSLSSEQLKSLNKMIEQQAQGGFLERSLSKSISHRLKWMVAMVASILLSLLALNYWQTPALMTPTLITSAYADIYKDSNLKNGLQPPMEQWLKVNKVSAVPREYPIKMSKFCRLGDVVTMHLRIAGKQQGEVNVFIHRGDRVSLLMDRSGSVDDINWKLIKVRNDLTLIVLYTQDMREKAVQHILSEMLPELRAELRV